MSKSIVIVEDEILLFENYQQALSSQGYTVRGYHSRLEAEQAFKSGLPDLVILDVGLQNEREAGFDLCRILRARSENLPIIFLTALDSDFDMISGLRLGADDYLTKDISLPHLLARVAALFRRIEAYHTKTPSDNILKQGHLSLDSDRFAVSWDASPVELTLTEFWIVHSLAKMPGHVKNREQLMRDANTYIDDSTVTSHIKRIRKKFQKIDPSFTAIESVYGLGYRWKL